MEIIKNFNNQFAEIVKLIHQARYKAIKNINTELIELYWKIGNYISVKIKNEQIRF